MTRTTITRRVASAGSSITQRVLGYSRRLPCAATASPTTVCSSKCSVRDPTKNFPGVLPYVWRNDETFLFFVCVFMFPFHCGSPTVARYRPHTNMYFSLSCVAAHYGPHTNRNCVFCTLSQRSSSLLTTHQYVMYYKGRERRPPSFVMFPFTN